MDPKKIVIAVVLVIVVYIVLRLIFDSPSKANLVGLHNAKHALVIPESKLKNEKNDYAYSIWVYINEWNHNYGEEKVIFSRKISRGSTNKFSPKLYLANDTNDLIAHIDTENSSEPFLCRAKNIPLQKWTHVLMTTYNNAIDIYIDGKLVKSCLMPGVPISAKGNDILLTPNVANGNEGSFSGFTRQFQFHSKALNPREVYEIYKSGPKGGFNIGSLFDRYKMKFSFLKDNIEVNSIEI